jgi:hypothetical protein
LVHRVSFGNEDWGVSIDFVEVYSPSDIRICDGKAAPVSEIAQPVPIS